MTKINNDNIRTISFISYPTTTVEATTGAYVHATPRIEEVEGYVDFAGEPQVVLRHGDHHRVFVVGEETLNALIKEAKAALKVAKAQARKAAKEA